MSDGLLSIPLDKVNLKLALDKRLTKWQTLIVKKEKRITFRLTLREFNFLKEEAKKNKMTIACFVRYALKRYKRLELGRW